MYKSLIILLLSLTFVSCDPQTMQKVLDTVDAVSDAPLTNLDISNGLKEALQFGVDNSVNFLSAEDGYYQSVYKILLPDEANKVIDKLSFIPGFKNLETELVKKVNRAAEDAAKKAGPIFLDAIKGITFNFGALDLWTSAVTKYNSIPLVSDVNTDLADHINTKALSGLFDLVEKKEQGIRADVSQRTTSILQKVFAKQDGT